MTVPASSDPLTRLEGVASSRIGVVLVGIWGFAEAVVLPIVPDVLLCLLVLLVPRRAAVLFGAVVIGALAGTAVLYVFVLTAPEVARAILLVLPGIDEGVLASATTAVAGGDPRGMAGLGPGIPLKVYTLAWTVGPMDTLGLAFGVVLNRITRVGSSVVAAAILGAIAPRLVRRWPSSLLIGYAALWAIVYAVYLR